MMAKKSDEVPFRITGERVHLKAGEAYFDVEFYYPEIDEVWKGFVPYRYRRTGLFAETDTEKLKVVCSAYDAMHPSKRETWLAEQDRFWTQMNQLVTGPFFEGLKDCQWKCQECQLPPNPNPARRIQAIKDLGYTIATDTKRYCANCGRNTTHRMMLRLPRGSGIGYERWSPYLRKRILKVLRYWDVYECNTRRGSLLPDHKFPEIRWDPREPKSLLDDMTDDEIKAKFQLLSNQRNEQKREVCRTCFQTGKRGTPYGIRFFYAGDENWPEDIPKTGEKAERGCIGCGWHDLNRWREELNSLLSARKKQRRTEDI